MQLVHESLGNQMSHSVIHLSLIIEIAFTGVDQSDSLAAIGALCYRLVKVATFKAVTPEPAVLFLLRR